MKPLRIQRLLRRFIHTCTVCDKRGTWGPGWRSLREDTSGGLLCVVCSPACAEDALAALRRELLRGVQ